MPEAWLSVVVGVGVGVGVERIGCLQVDIAEWVSKWV